MEIEYPIRCRIIDAEGLPVGPYLAKMPEVSKPHIGKEGLATKSVKFRRDAVKIVLDDGNVIYGHDCWWEPLS